jgi:hypothetical protein
MNTPQHPDFQRNNPLRPIAWRWERAQWLLSHHRNFSRRRDDEPTRHALAFLRDLARRSPTRSALLEKRFPIIYGAHQLHADEAKKLIIEARLLARQSSAEIARLADIPAEVVEAYEAIFFNCLDRINAKDWIVIHAIRRRTFGRVETAAAALLKLFAYNGGPLVLDAVLPYLTGKKDPFEPVIDLSVPAGRHEQALRLLIMAHLLPEDPSTALKLQKILLIVREKERYRRDQRVPAPILAQNLVSNLAEVLRSAPSDGANGDTVTPLTMVELVTRQIA